MRFKMGPQHNHHDTTNITTFSDYSNVALVTTVPLLCYATQHALCVCITAALCCFLFAIQQNQHQNRSITARVQRQNSAQYKGQLLLQCARAESTAETSQKLSCTCSVLTFQHSTGQRSTQHRTRLELIGPAYGLGGSTTAIETFLPAVLCCAVLQEPPVLARITACCSAWPMTPLASRTRAWDLRSSCCWPPG